MRLCIPTTDDRGHEGTLSAHFGSAPYFTLVDSETGALEVVANPRSRHAPGTCEVVQGLPAHHVEAIVCLGLGRRALSGLRNSGIAVYVADVPDVQGALKAFRAGRLPALTNEQACHGGRHGGSHHNHPK